MKFKLLSAACGFAGFVLIFAALSLAPGCSGGGTPPPMPTGTVVVPPVPNPNKPIIVAAITGGAQLATSTGLRTLAKSNPNAAAETATALKANITTTLLPYLQGTGTQLSASVVHDLLNSSLFNNVNLTIKQIIQVASSMIPNPPGAATYLTEDQRDYAVAFLNGISKGCNDFQARALPEPRWIDME